MKSLPPPEPASATPQSTLGDSPKPFRRTLACVRCQQRKKKCSRVFPCPHCLRAKVQCVVATPAPRHRRRRPNQALKERLARCEELLEKHMDKDDECPLNFPAVVASSHSQSDPSTSKWISSDGKLVEEGGKLAFMDNHLLELVHDEIQAMRELVKAQGGDDSPLDTDTPDDECDLVFGGESPQSNIEYSWPNPALVFRLWQLFLDRVNPLTKVIHVPSFQPYVAQATSGPQQLPENITTLMLAIFLMAAVSLSDGECEGILGDSRELVINRFSSAVRRSLQRLGILQRIDLVVLQTLVLYMISLQGRYNRHSAWILNGFVIRIAQKLGLHRDGEALGLKPFESEMRRRVWWQIIAIDCKFALFSGLGHSLLPRDWNVREPQNLNDADMFPSATHPFPDRDGPTDMILCLTQCKITKFLVETPGLEPLKMMSQLDDLKAEDSQPDALRDEQINHYRMHFDTLEESLHRLLETRCNPSAGQVHNIARGVVTTILNQKRELINGFGYQSESNTIIQSKDYNAFASTVAIMEHATSLYTSTESTGFLWFVLLNVQLDVFTYMVVQLGHRIEGRTVERAWTQVEILYQFHQALFDLNNTTFWRLAHFVLRAWAKRGDRLSCLGQFREIPAYIERLQRNLVLTSDSETIRPNPSSLSFDDAAEPILGMEAEDGRPVGIPCRPGDGSMGTGDTDWSFLDTIATAQFQEATGTAFMGYGAGPWVEW
ncbi:fungal-specific transcription factor domain-containing protein [Ilyonectria robusta]|uniref:fungal-specific transcription factor domain-containing protein n=1 Tax=Ilyonectria robusta TaxID=1079257 RepID=UPI001E8EC58A|nr:fungal-specific transcription factor domain-containing protein [Ilyonectria robusta]KAH8685058.1 fungal-specific transcription factor domain-containing protein [Ilyonectria robusta]